MRKDCCPEREDKFLSAIRAEEATSYTENFKWERKGKSSYAGLPQHRQGHRSICRKCVLVQREAGADCGTLHWVALTGDTAAEASVPLLQAPALQLLPGLFIYPSGTVRTFTA